MPEIAGISQEILLEAGMPGRCDARAIPGEARPGEESDQETEPESSCQTTPTQTGRSSTTTLWPASPSRQTRMTHRDGFVAAGPDLDSDGAWHGLKAQVLALLKAAPPDRTPPDRMASFETKVPKDASPENKRESPHATPRGARESPHREWLMREPKSSIRPATAARVGHLRDRNFFRTAFSTGLDPPPTASPSKGLRSRTKDTTVPAPAPFASVAPAPAALTAGTRNSVEAWGAVLPRILSGALCPEDCGVSVAVSSTVGVGGDFVSAGLLRGTPQRAKSDGRRAVGSTDPRAQDVFSSPVRGVQRARSDSRRLGAQRDGLWNRDLTVMVALAAPVGPMPSRPIPPQAHSSSPEPASSASPGPALLSARAATSSASPGPIGPSPGPMRARSDGRRAPDERPSWPTSQASPSPRHSLTVKAAVPGVPLGVERLRLQEAEAPIRIASELRFTPRAGTPAQELVGRGRPPESGRRVVASRA